MGTQAQKITIPTILEVGTNRIENTATYLERASISKVVIFFGEGIKMLFGEKLLNSIQASPYVELLESYEFDEIRLENLISEAFSLPAETHAVIGIGGGKVLDCAKYIAFLNDIPFISIPTSTSNDAFASSGCSLYISGRRKSVHAAMPYGIIVDLDIVKNSPEKFIYSGLGDIVSKITAIYDWYFEQESGKGKVKDFAAMLAKKSANSIVRLEHPNIKENFFLKEMVDSLTMSGIAMEIAGSSAPASGSEHLISHALDKVLERPELHGLQVGVSTYLMSLVQQHRSVRIEKFFTETGFFDFVATLNMKKSDFEKAIDLAPSVKPNRFTTIHVEENRIKAKELLYSNLYLSKILK